MHSPAFLARRVGRPARRGLASANGFLDSRLSFSPAWKSIDEHRHDDGHTPDPLSYLQGFDNEASTSVYRQALVKVCSPTPGMAILDVGCGLGKSALALARSVAPSGRVVGVDVSLEAIARARLAHDHVRGLSFLHANAYDLSGFACGEFDAVLADRVLQHLDRPLEAMHEMRRVVRAGGVVVCGDPDWRSFQIDVTGAGTAGASPGSADAEAGRRWGDWRRPPAEIACDFGELTRRVLAGVIPTLSAHSYMGLALPRLLRAAGLDDIELTPVTLLFSGRTALEAVVPITYMSYIAENHGAISPDDRKRWLARLSWEGDDKLFGALTVYVARARVAAPPMVTLEGGCAVSAHMQTRQLRSDEAEMRSAEVAALINDAYRDSDTNITLSTERVPVQDVCRMIRTGEIIVAEAAADGAIVGCVQVLIKSNPRGGTKEAAKKQGDAGLPPLYEGLVGEFTCLAVSKADAGAWRRAGIGSALVRAAEAHCRAAGCKRMLLSVLCPNVPPEEEPDYKRWLQRFYLRLGYDHAQSPALRFETDEEGRVVVDELNEMYACLRQVVQCKAILMTKGI